MVLILNKCTLLYSKSTQFSIYYAVYVVFMI